MTGFDSRRHLEPEGAHHQVRDVHAGSVTHLERKCTEHSSCWGMGDGNQESISFGVVAEYIRADT